MAVAEKHADEVLSYIGSQQYKTCLGRFRGGFESGIGKDRAFEFEMRQQCFPSMLQNKVDASDATGEQEGGPCFRGEGKERGFRSK